MIVGEKNMHSSSGCAVIRRTFPSSFSDLFPVNHLVTRATNRTDMKPIPKLTDQREVRRAIFHLALVDHTIILATAPCICAWGKRMECAITATLYHILPRHCTSLLLIAQHNYCHNFNWLPRKNLYTKRFSFCALLCITTWCLSPWDFSKEQISSMVKKKIYIAIKLFVTTQYLTYLACYEVILWHKRYLLLTEGPLCLEVTCQLPALNQNNAEVNAVYTSQFR